MVLEASTEREVKIVHTDDSLDIKEAAQTLAYIVTGGDSNAYINNIIKNRKKNEAGREYENA